MFVLIAGGGRTGTQLASLLVKQNHKVHLIEDRPELLKRLHQELPTEVVYEGQAIDLEVLEHAGAREAQVLVACTSIDADNLAICYSTRKHFHVPRIIARINNPRNAWLFDDKFQVDVALNQAEILANLIEEEMSLGDMITLLKLRRGEYAFVEEKIPPDAKAVGIPIENLDLPEECVIAAIIREGKVVVPRGITTIKAGDEIFAITDRKGAEQLSTMFSPTK